MFGIKINLMIKASGLLGNDQQLNVEIVFSYVLKCLSGKKEETNFNEGNV